jgi:hypothetical protein
MRVVLFAFIALSLAQFSDPASCAAQSYGGCIFSGSSWQPGTWPCVPKSCPFHIKPLPGDCKDGALPWPSKGNVSGQPYNEVGVTMTVTEALKKDLFDFALTPTSAQLNGFTLAGKPNQYFAFDESGTLLSAAPNGSTVAYNLPNSASFVASPMYVVSTWANDTTGLTDVGAISNSISSGPMKIAHLPGTKLETWPIFADGKYVYATILNTVSCGAATHNPHTT